MKMNLKKLLGIIFAVMIVPLGFAICQMTITTQTAMTVSSDGTVVSFIDGFENFNLGNVTIEGATHQETAQIMNADGSINMLVGVEIITTDVEDSCTDYENDVTHTLQINGTTVTDGEQIVLNGGYTDVTLNTEAVRFSCPQSQTVILTLTSTA